MVSARASWRRPLLSHLVCDRFLIPPIQESDFLTWFSTPVKAPQTAVPLDLPP